MNEARAILDARMTARVSVTAGPHDIGLRSGAARAAPGRLAAVAPDSQEITFGGLPKLKTVGVEGPYNVTGVSSTPSRERLFVCNQRERNHRGATACGQRVLSNLARRAYRRPVTAADLEARCRSNARRAGGGSFDAGIRAGVARILASRTSLPYRTRRTGVKPGAQPVSDVELASSLSSSSGAASPTRGCWTSRLPAACASRPRSPAKCAA